MLAFGREVRRVVELRRAQAPMLWLLDEFARGTHPEEGAVLAEELLEARQRAGDLVVAATHFPQLARSDAFEHLQITGISHPEALDQLGDAPTLADMEDIALTRNAKRAPTLTGALHT